MLQLALCRAVRFAFLVGRLAKTRGDTNPGVIGSRFPMPAVRVPSSDALAKPACKKSLSRDASTQFIRPAKQPQLPLHHVILALAQEKHPDAKFTCGNRSGGLCQPLKKYPRTRWRVFQIPLAKETDHATGDRVCLSENCVNCTEHRTQSPSDHCRSFWIFFQPQQERDTFKNPAAPPGFWDTCHTITRITLSITELCHSTTESLPINLLPSETHANQHSLGLHRGWQQPPQFEPWEAFTFTTQVRESYRRKPNTYSVNVAICTEPSTLQVLTTDHTTASSDNFNRPSILQLSAGLSASLLRSVSDLHKIHVPHSNQQP